MACVAPLFVDQISKSPKILEQVRCDGREAEELAREAIGTV
jgi:hypothetical protein